MLGSDIVDNHGIRSNRSIVTHRAALIYRGIGSDQRRPANLTKAVYLRAWTDVAEIVDYRVVSDGRTLIDYRVPADFAVRRQDAHWGNVCAFANGNVFRADHGGMY